MTGVFDEQFTMLAGSYKRNKGISTGVGISRPYYACQRQS